MAVALFYVWLIGRRTVCSTPCPLAIAGPASLAAAVPAPSSLRLGPGGVVPNATKCREALPIFLFVTNS